MIHAPAKTNVLARYGVAILAVAVAAGLRWALTPLYGDRLPYITFFPAIIIGALAGGMGPGLLALGISTVLATRWLPGMPWAPPPEAGRVPPHAAILVGSFLLTGGLMVGVCQAARTAWARAGRAAASADARAREFRAMFERSWAGQAQTDPATRGFVRVNQKFCELTGYSEAELLRMTSVELTHPDDRAADVAATEGVLSGGREGWELEKRIVRKDGSVRWVRVSGAVVRGGGGEPERLIAAVHDVTGQRKAQRALRDSDDRYRAFIANSSEGVYRLEFDPPIDTSLPVGEQVERAYRDGRFAECNDAMARMYGLERAEDLVGKTLDFMLPASSEPARAYVASIVEGGYRAVEVESEERDAHGRVVHFANSMVGVLEGGRLLRVWGTQRDVSARRRADEALRESEARLREADGRLRLAMRFAHVGTWTIDLATGGVSASESTDAMFGLAPAPAAERRLEDYLPAVHPDDRERFGAEVRAAAAAGNAGGSGVLSIEYRLVRPDGTVRWVASRGDVERGPDGRAERMAGAVFDITDRKLAETALADREHSYRELFESTTDAIFVGDEQGRYVDVNPAAAALLGLPVAELIGRRARDFILPEHAPMADEVRAALRRDGVWAGEFPMVRADGRRVIVEYRSRWQNGRVVGFARDVTERKRAEEAIGRLAAIVESTDDAVIGKGLDGVITSWNAGAERLLGYAASAAIGKPAAMMVPQDRAAEEAMILDRLRRGERVPSFETRRVRKDGTEVDVSITSSPIRDASGRVVGASTIAHDIGVRKRAEELLRRSNELLEQAIAERTKELEDSHQRLRHSERMAALGTLAAGVGHDLANLLLPIRVRLDAVEAGGGAGEDTQSIRKSLDYLAQLAQGLRLLARDSDAPPGPGDAVEASEWWASVQALMRNPLPRGVELVADIPRGLPRAAVTTPGLTQCVFNLVQNAGDAMRERGHGRVVVSARAAGEGGGGGIEFSVSDDGPGMSPDVARRCFEPYFSTKPRGISTGLGLAFVQGLVGRAGGSVRVESAPGRGTTFTITLPTAAERAAGGARRAAVSVRDARTASVLRTVLPTFGFEASVRSPAAGAGGAAADGVDAATLVWITDDTKATAEVARFLRGDPAREVLVVASHADGIADGLDDGAARARVTVVGSPLNLAAVRDRLRAMAGRS